MYQKPIVITKLLAIVITIKSSFSSLTFSATHSSPNPPEDYFLNIPINRDQWRSMVEQSPKNCSIQKQTASNPETQFSPLIAQWQNPLIGIKNLIPANE
jgi:hypothetical protein